MSHVFGHLEAYFFRESLNRDNSKVIYQDINRQWKEVSCGYAFVTKIKIIQDRGSPTQIAQMGFGNVNLCEFSPFLVSGGGGYVRVIHKTADFDAEIKARTKVCTDIDSTGTRIVYVAEEKLGVYDIPTGKVVKSKMVLPKAKTVRIVDDKFLLLGLESISFVIPLYKPVKDLEMESFPVLLGKGKLVSSTEIKVIEDKYIVYLSKSQEKQGVFVCALDNFGRVLKFANSDSSKGLYEISSINVFKLDHSKFLLVGGHSATSLEKAQESVWAFSLDQLEKDLKDEKTKVLKHTSFGKWPLKTIDGWKELRKSHPIGYEVSDIHSLGILDIQRPDLRKETQDFLVQNVVSVPTAILEIVTVFIVGN